MERRHRIPKAPLSSMLCFGLALVGCSSQTLEEQPQATETAPPPRAAAKPEPRPEPVAEASPSAAGLPKTVAEFDSVLATAAAIYEDHRRSFYCNCTFTADDRVARGTCGYQTRANDSLSKRIRWERVVPVRDFGAERACWTGEGCGGQQATQGVECCERVDPAFHAMANDLHNLVPAIGEVAQDRSDYPFGEIAGEERLYGSCDFEVDREAGITEPGEKIRGDIARTYLYMHRVYADALPLTPEQIAMFEAWHAADPPDAWEIERNARITAIQGVPNPMIPLRAASKVASVVKPPAVQPAPTEETIAAKPSPTEEPSAAEAIFKVGKDRPGQGGAP